MSPMHATKTMNVFKSMNRPRLALAAIIVFALFNLCAGCHQDAQDAQDAQDPNALAAVKAKFTNHPTMDKLTPTQRSIVEAMKNRALRGGTSSPMAATNAAPAATQNTAPTVK